MPRRSPTYYTESQRALMWERWQRGESLQTIAQLFDRNHSSVQRILRTTGGIRPPERRRAAKALSLAEREEISRSMVAGASTVAREIQRNGGAACYRANMAEQYAWDRALRPKPCKLLKNRELAQVVAQKLRQQWSPEQIAGWLKREYPGDESQHVSH